MRSASFLSLLSSLTLAAFVCVGCAGEGSDPQPDTGEPEASEPDTSEPDADAGAVEDAGAPMNEGLLLLDVRTPAEYEDGHVNGSVLIPVDTVPANTLWIETAAGGLDGEIIVTCESGVRAQRAVDALVQAGFTDVTNEGNWATMCAADPVDGRCEPSVEICTHEAP